MSKFFSASERRSSINLSSQNVSKASRRQLMRVLRMAHRTLGMKRSKLALGVGIGVALVAGSLVISSTPAFAQSLGGGSAIGNATAISPSGACSTLTLANALANSNLAIAMGCGSAATAMSAVAIGTSASASGNSSIAMGNNAAASMTNAVAIGTNSVASGASSTAVGASAKATAFGSYAMGFATTAAGQSSLAAGYSSSTGTGGTNATAVGSYASATNMQALAFGYQVKAEGVNSTAIGSQATAGYTGTIAIGTNAKATIASGGTTADHAIAIGDTAWALKDDAMALGYMSMATGVSSISLGERSYAQSDYDIVLGSGASTNGTGLDMALGVNAIAGGGESTTIGYNAQSLGLRAIALGATANADYDYSVAIGYNAVVSKANAIAIGQLTRAGLSAVAIGDGAAATTDYSVALGAQATTARVNAVALGYKSTAGGTSSVALGDGATVTNNANFSVAIGSAALIGANVNNGIALGTSANVTYHNGIALGNTSAAKAADAIAIGNAAQATGGYAVVLGSQASAPGNYGIVIGQGASMASTTSGTAAYSIAIGGTSYVGGQSAIAFGYKASVAANYSMAMGASANSYGLYDVVIGYSAVGGVAGGTSTNNNTAVGRSAQATGGGSVAFGYLTISSGSSSTAIGNTAKATANSSTAFGTLSTASASWSTALGPGATASNEHATAIGSSAKALGADTIAIGQSTRADGSDSIAIGFLATTGAATSNSIAIGSYSEVTSINSLALGYEAFASGASSTAIGYASEASGASSLAVGYNSAASGANATAVGYIARATGESGTALGNYSNAAGLNSISIGRSSAAYEGATTIGYFSFAMAKNATSLGTGAYSRGVSSTALGDSARANEDNSVALGASSLTAAAVSTASITINGKAYNFAGDVANSTVSVGSADLKRTITNVAAGSISATSTDAINGSQLFAVNASIEDATTGLAAALGGGAGYTGGVWTAPTYVITSVAADGTTTSSTYNNVGDALGGISTSLGNANTHINNVETNLTNLTTNIVNGEIGPVQRTATTTLSLIASGGSASAPGVAQKLANVADGEISASSLEAVNGSQLYALSQSIGGSVDALLWDDTYGMFSASHGSTLTNKITNVEAGDVSSYSTEAINGSQLNETNQNTSQYLGGGADVAGGGVAPTYNITNVAVDGTTTSSTYNNVGDALGGLNTSIGNTNTHLNSLETNVTNLTTNITNGEIGPVQRTATTTLSLIASGGDASAPGVAQKLTNVAPGTLSAVSTDAVNGSQLYATNLNTSQYLGGGADIGAGTAPTYNITNVAVDGTTTSSTYNNVGDALGGLNTSIGNTNTHLNSLETNVTNLTTNITNGEIGPVQRTATTTLSLIASGGNASAPGAAQKLTNVADGAVTANSLDAVNGSQLYALGQTITDLSTDALLWDDTLGAFSASHGAVTTNKITNVAAGTLSAVSTDAVNGSQLYATNLNTSQYLGGGADIGAGTAPTYNITNVAVDGTTTSSTYNNVGDALGGLNTSIGNTNTHLNSLETNVTNLTTNITNGEIGPVQRTATTTLSLIASGGNASAPGAAQKLTNVADGAVTASSLDAVNGSQLYALGQTITNLGADALLWDDTYGMFSASHGSTLTNKITNIEAGDVSSYSTEAINGSQLHNTNQNTSQYFGGGADVAAGVAPDYVITNVAVDGTTTSTTYNNVGDALGGVNTSIGNTNTHLNSLETNVTNLTTNITNGEIGPVQRTATTTLSLIASGGNASAPGAAQKLDNVADGAVTATSLEAVNGSQLYALGQTITDLGTDALLWDNTLGAFSASHGAVTTNKITNVAAGTLSAASTDAVNGSQLYATNLNTSQYLGGGADIGAGTAPTYNITNVAVDGTTTSSTYNNVGDALGGLNTSIGNTNTHLNSLETNVTNLTTNITNGEIGPVQRTATTTLSLIASGGDASAPGAAQKLDNVADGAVTATSLEAVNGSQLYALGQTITDLGTDALLWDDTLGAFSASHGAVTTNKITNVAAGTLSAASTDAVNGSQLYATNLNTSQYLGGGADIGAGTAPTYNITNVAVDGTTTSSTYNNVGDALGGLNTSIGNTNTHLNSLETNVTNLTTNITNGEIGPVQRTATTTLSLIASGGNASAPGAAQKLTNVAPGTLSAASTDAVNGSQLYATNLNTSQYLGGGADIGAGTAPTYNITNVAVDGTTTSSTYNNVGDALGGLNTSIGNTNTHLNSLETNVTNLTTNITNGEIGPVQRTATTTLSLIASGGNASAPGAAQKLDNVADGAVTATSLEAVNGSQLYALGQTITDLGTDALLWDDTLGAFSASHGAVTTNKITNVAAGTLSAASTDAVNGSQLYATNLNTSQYLGGGADIGAGTAPTYNITNVAVDGTTTSSTYNNVGDALGGLNTSIGNTNTHLNSLETNVTNLTTNITNGEIGPVQRTATAVLSLIAAGGDASNPGAAQKLTNVADGAVTASSLDAVNGSQLYALTQNVENLNTDALLWDDLLGSYSASHGSSAQNKITNVAAGTLSVTSTDAVNGSQLFTTNQTVASYFGGGASFDGSTWTAPTYNIARIGVDGTTTTVAYNNVGDALGGVNSSISNVNTRVDNITTNIDNGTVGPVQRTGNENELTLVADGGDASNPGDAQKLTNVADGDVSANSSDAVNGSQLHETNQNVATIGEGSASALGGGASYDSETGTWTGPTYNLTNVNSDGSTTTNSYDNVGDALGGLSNSVNNVNNRVDNIDNSIEVLQNDALLWDNNLGAFSASHGSSQTNKITNVAAGTLSATSTDAVNGSQLYETNQKVEELDQNAVKYDLNPDGTKSNTVTLEGGDPNAPVVITNVAAGVNDSDAVNVAQLREAVSGGSVNNQYIDQRVQQTLQESRSYTDYKSAETLQQANAYTDMKFDSLNQEITKAKKEARQAAAVGLAAASLRYDNRPGKWSTAVGGGAWRGEGAFAMGVGYTSEDGMVRANLSATTSGGHWGVGGGLSITLN
ncbi:YadA-like family protein [Microvirga sp. W0021]|uniref:YadA-like family protein n=1 Tax=Hohaiivirga grylli TaxID=3133970 RepID=A0ABV0BEQ9_9HYPH